MVDEPHSLSDRFVDDVGNEVEVVTSEMQPRSDSEDVQPMELGAYVGIIRVEDNETGRTEEEVLGRSCLDEAQLKFIDSLHKITGCLTSEGKFVPNTVLEIGKSDIDTWFFGDVHMKAEIFVRESFVALADIILADFETRDIHCRSGIILGGTAGVGKSTFLAFLLCCCYVQRKYKPQLFGDVLLSINKDKPVRLHWDETRGRYVCWPFRRECQWIYLFDVIIGSSAPERCNAYVVAACSPSSDYSAFSKLDVGRLFMPVWSEAELLTCGTKCTRIQFDEKKIKMLYSMVGGIARKVLQSGKMDEIKLINLHQYMKEGYGKCSINDIMDVVNGTKNPHMSHRVIYMQPTKDYMYYEYVFGSPKIKQEYLTTKMTLNKDQVLEYAAMLTDPRAQSMRGFIFEQIAHCLFYDGGCVLAVKQLLQREPNGTELRWRFRVGNAKLVDGNHIRDDLQDGEYGIGTRHLSGIDGVLQPDILFQMTVSTDNKINLPGLVNASLQMNETTRKICVLFVVPKDIYVQFPYQNFDRVAPSANHKFIHAAHPVNSPTVSEMEDYVKRRVHFGVVCVDLNDTNVRNKVKAAFNRCNSDLLSVRSRNIDVQ